MSEKSHEKATPKLKRTLFILSAIVIVMLGFSYAMVPLYRVLCNVLGINGKTSNTVTVNERHMDQSRTIDVQFVSNINGGLNWEFKPLVRRISVHPGQNGRVAFYAKNNTDHTVTIQAIPSVAPGNAAKYLKKTQCFCFTRQILKAHQSIDMPVIFHVDNALPKKIHSIVLSYTLFEIKN